MTLDNAHLRTIRITSFGGITSSSNHGSLLLIVKQLLPKILKILMIFSDDNFRNTICKLSKCQVNMTTFNGGIALILFSPCLLKNDGPNLSGIISLTEDKLVISIFVHWHIIINDNNRFLTIIIKLDAESATSLPFIISCI